MKQTVQRRHRLLRSAFQIGFFDLQTRRLIEPTTRWREAMGI